MKTNFIERNKIIAKKPVLDLTASKTYNGFSFGVYNQTPKTPLIQKFGFGHTLIKKPLVEGKENSIKQFMKHISPIKSVNMAKNTNHVRESLEAMSLEKPQNMDKMEYEAK